jgi:hypothetical protein
LLLTSCTKPLAPRRLAHLPRTKLVTGAQAVALLAQMHQGRLQPPQAEVATYGGNRLTLYVARFASAHQAQQALERMLKGLDRSSQFSPPRLQGADQQRYVTLGPGGHHLFWRSQLAIYWLAGEPAAVFAASEELPAPARGATI